MKKGRKLTENRRKKRERGDKRYGRIKEREKKAEKK